MFNSELSRELIRITIERKLDKDTKSIICEKQSLE